MLSSIFGYKSDKRKEKREHDNELFLIAFKICRNHGIGEYLDVGSLYWLRLTNKRMGRYAAGMIRKRMTEEAKVYVHVCLNGMREYGIPNDYDPDNEDVWEVETYNEKDMSQSTLIRYTDSSAKQIPMKISNGSDSPCNFVPALEPDVKTSYEWRSIVLDHKLAKDCVGDEKSVDDYTGQSIWVYVENNDGSFDQEKTKVAVFKLSPLVDKGEQVSGGENSVQLRFRVNDCSIDVTDPTVQNEVAAQPQDVERDPIATEPAGQQEELQAQVDRLQAPEQTNNTSILNRTYRFTGRFEILEVRVSFALLVRLYASKAIAHIKRQHAIIQKTRKLNDKEIRELKAIEALFEQTKKK